MTPTNRPAPPCPEEVFAEATRWYDELPATTVYVSESALFLELMKRFPGMTFQERFSAYHRLCDIHMPHFLRGMPLIQPIVLINFMDGREGRAMMFNTWKGERVMAFSDLHTALMFKFDQS